ncbi:MAG: hypothetical protein U0792_21875 [Gemmataceae bacterium]
MNQGASVNTLNNSGAALEVYRRIVGQWLETREDPIDLNQLAHVVSGQLRGFPQSLPLMRRIVTTDGVYGYAKAQKRSCTLNQQRGKGERCHSSSRS